MNLICFGYNPWSRMWKRNQQIIWLLARKSWLRSILFLNPEVWLSSIIENPIRSLRPPGVYSLRFILPRKVNHNIVVFTPCYLPFSGRSPTLRRVMEIAFRQVMSRYLTQPFIVLVNRPIDPAHPALAEAFQKSALRLFDWSDDFEEFSDSKDDRLQTRSICEHYIRACDIVLAVNDKLGERAKRLNENVYVIRNATSLENYARAMTVDATVPRKLRELSRPVIGYVGYRVTARLDLDLIDYLAVNRPTWTFVFVGPCVGSEPLSEIIRKRRNVRVMAAVDYFSLASYITSFDVCILPNRLNSHTEGNDPIKLYDYLASGRPIVATPVAGVELFGDLIKVADEARSFLEAIEEVLARDTQEKRKKRLEIARQHSWEARVETVSEIILAELRRHREVVCNNTKTTEPSALDRYHSSRSHET